MSRGKSVVKTLLDASISALFAGIEIHNKPHVCYRYQTVVILIINAWELALKAYIYKFIGRDRIYEKESDENKFIETSPHDQDKDGKGKKCKEKHTIPLTKALTCVENDIYNKEQNKEFKACCENIKQLNKYRSSFIHFGTKKLDPIMFMLASKSVINYDAFIKKYFNKDITRDDNLIILPVGFKLPFNPIDYLKQNYSNVSNEFVLHVISSIRRLGNEKINDSVIVGFDVFTSSIKKVNNADIIAAIDQLNGEIKLTKSVRVTTDPNAPVCKIEPEIPPLKYADLCKKIKEQRPDIKIGKTFNDAMKIIKADTTLCQRRYLDPKKQEGLKKDFFQNEAVDMLIVQYDKLKESI